MAKLTVKEELIKQELGADGSPAGVELEVSIPLADSFDPNSISIEPKQVTMDHLLRRLRQGSIRLAPSLQRQFVWDRARSSQLIESLMLRIPLPMFYVSANEDGSWDVVDGLQRLTTIRNYLLGEEKNKDGTPSVPGAESFALESLEFWGARFNGKRFSQIERDKANARIINNIMETEMRFTVINPATPEAVKRNIFKRINTGGMPLTSQEIRHALYQGQASTLLETLAKSPSFIQATGDSVDDSRMAARELILRFLAFSLRGHETYSGDMDAFLSDTMQMINHIPGAPDTDLKIMFPKYPSQELNRILLGGIVVRFELAMQHCFEFFGVFAFRKAVSGMRRPPINKALFDTWASLFAVLPDEDFHKLTSRKSLFFADYQKVLENAVFERAISRDASSVDSTRYRYFWLEALIKQTLGQ